MCVERERPAMTEQLYLPDADDVTTFTATVTEATTEYIVLDGTYFYPEGGGQPADTGRIEWDGGHATVGDVRKDHGDIHHVVDKMAGDPPAAGTEVAGHIDEQRRANLTRMHTAQHVVSRVVLDEYGATTAGNQVHADRSRIDFEPVSFDESDVERIERLSNEAIERDLAVRKENRDRETVEREVDEGRALLDLIPDSVDPLRVVEIESFDMCPCGGTHVDSLGEVGRVSIIDRTSKGADTERIEFELEEPVH
jgi:misacylated tRNA(Ala) deacylase